MKILVFPLSYPNEINQTANIFTKEQVDELSKTNDVVVAFIQLLPTRFLFKRKKRRIVEYNDGVNNVYKIELHTFFESKFPRINGFFYKRVAFKLLKRVVKDFKPDCIYAHFSIYSGWAATLFGKKMSIPVVVQEHDGKLIAPILDNTRKKMLTTVCNESDALICVSDNLRTHVQLFTNSNKKIHVIGNPVSDSFVFHPLIQKSCFVFLVVANLYPGKNVDLLVKSFCETFNPMENVSLRICGDGECRKKIEKIIESFDRKSQILLLGRIERTKIVEEYKNCDCFVLPSDHETFGIVYREAMATGRPIITTNHGGFNENELNDANSIVVSVDDNSLGHALREMKNNIDKYNLQEISKNCLKAFGKDNIINSINNVLKDAVAKRKSN